MDSEKGLWEETIISRKTRLRLAEKCLDPYLMYLATS